MKTVEISRLAMIIALAGTIFASGAAGCVVHERTVRVAPQSYPVIVGRYPPPRPWYAAPKPWVHGCGKRYRARDCRPRYYEADRPDGHDRRRGRPHQFEG